MAGLRGAGGASFDVSFEADSGEEFDGFYARDVDVSDLENNVIASSDDDTVTLDPDDSDDAWFATRTPMD